MSPSYRYPINPTARSPAAVALMALEEAPPSGWIPIGHQRRRITSESEIGDVALELAADRGDPSPHRVQHVTCTRSNANRVMCGDVVPGERRSWLIAIEGSFVTRRPRRPFVRGSARDHVTEERKYSVITLVVDAETGAPTDSGSSNDFPDLAAAGPVITDYPAL